jgi:hypothetical protein
MAQSYINCYHLYRKYAKKICQFVLLSFFEFDILRNYDLILIYLNFKTLLSRQRNLDALFLIIVSKGKDQLPLHLRHCRYLCPYKASKRILYFQREQRIKT